MGWATTTFTESYKAGIDLTVYHVGVYGIFNQVVNGRFPYVTNTDKPKRSHKEM